MGRFRSVMKHDFSKVPSVDIQRSSFNRSHGYKTTFDAGYLIPFFSDEVLPGDTFKLRADVFARIQPLVVPIMDNMFLDTQFWFVPLRLLWTNFEKFMGAQDNPGDSIDFLVPQMVSPTGAGGNGYSVGSISDYLGIPTLVPGLSHSALYHRAYNLIYNEWYRDENLQDSVYFTKGDGPDVATSYNLLRRGKRHDYFTSCLPWPQKGDPVLLPLGGQAPLVGSTGVFGPALSGASALNGNLWQVSAPGAAPITGRPDNTSGSFVFTSDPNTALSTWTDLTLATEAQYTSVGGAYQPPYVNLANGLGAGAAPYADLSSATAVTVNAIRLAFQVQRMHERDARGGTRYTEIVRSHFGTISPDARLQRPEYLGGSSVPVSIHPVAQTTPASGDGTPLANLGAMGTISAHGHGFSKSFTEHGIILGLVSVRADLNYQQGLDRRWSRSTRNDFYWPTLAHIGEQGVLNKEIYAQGDVNPTVDAAIFGYQERYAEYRYKNSLITGKFRSSDPQSLDVWHLAQDFTALPVLNDSFIVENPPVARVVSVTTEPQFILDSYFNLICARPMPTYSVPGFIDHF